MNFNDLKARIKSYSRMPIDDNTLNSIISTAESEIFRRINVEQDFVLAEISLTSTTNLYELPSDFWRFAGDPYFEGGLSLEKVVLDEQVTKYDGLTGIPTTYVLQGNSLRVSPRPSTDLKLQFPYFKKPIALDSTNLTNNIIDLYPDLYFFGCLREAYFYLNDRENKDKYHALYEKKITDINSFMITR